MIPNIKAQDLVVSDKKIFSRHSYISLCQTYDSWGGAIFSPMVSLNNFGRGSLGNATSQIPRL